ncbi:hypothetical protein K431DRAFT_306476 [Polychaeton citri CBS 116435]|uniref:BTB domain-containing protein n=1 Tax=Polychaeton citri CBS 116435 TaxID=1314669 RepID=A0A9P4Q3W1_9PEZI|nr:hypothetical protein K431DRAFT_306476 [Polychaeton citri CBS 116435]
MREVEETTRMARQDDHPFALRITKLYRDPQFSDLEIEGSTGVIEHTAFGVCTVKQMLQWMYTGMYTMDFAVLNSLEQDMTDSPDRVILVHADVYAIADYYQVPELQELACQKLKENASSIPTYVITEVARKLIGDEQLLTAVTEEEGLGAVAAFICRHVVLTNIEQIVDLKEADAKNDAQADEISSLYLELERLTYEVNKEAVILEVLSGSQDSCRDCLKTFGSCVERSPDGTWLLRCRRCIAIHNPTKDTKLQALKKLM